MTGFFHARPRLVVAAEDEADAAVVLARALDAVLLDTAHGVVQVEYAKPTEIIRSEGAST